MCGYGLTQSTVGIVGLGRIGETPPTHLPAPPPLVAWTQSLVLHTWMLVVLMERLPELHAVRALCLL